MDAARARRVAFRGAVAIVVFLLQLTFAGVLLGILIGFSTTYVQIHERTGSPFDDLPVEIAVTTAIAILGLGAWLHVGLGHWRLRTAYAAVAGVVLAAYSMDTVIGPLLESVLPMGMIDSSGLALETYVLRGGALGAWLALSLLGVPIGEIARRTASSWYQSRRSARRAQTRTQPPGMPPS